MATKRGHEWETDSEVYSESQIEALLNEAGVEIESATGTHFLCYCPFHNNSDTPAFAIDMELGQWICFSGVCGRAGNLEQLLTALLKDKNLFQIKRLIIKHSNADTKPFLERLADISKEAELPSFEQSTIDRMHEDLWNSPAESYMRGRGFTDDTLKHFKVGYSKGKNLVAVPMYDPKDNPVGVIGRTLEGKRFRNSDNLPKKELLWNFNNAKRHGDVIIICEATFDAMRIHQAGYPNVVAILSGHLSPWHIDAIDKTFSTIVVFTDFERDKMYYVNCAKCKKQGHKICNGHRPGRDAGRKIAENFPHKRVMWAAYDDNVVFPHHAKDSSDMTDEEIRQCIQNMVSNLAYVMWNPEETVV